MAGKRSGAGGKTPEMNDYRYGGSHRKNIPPAKMAAEGTVPVIAKAQYAYNPHLPPTGVDIYNPVENKVLPSGADKVAAWFLDGDYDGRTFCITQAFFPDRSAWDKLQRALNGKDGVIDVSKR